MPWTERFVTSYNSQVRYSIVFAIFLKEKISYDVHIRRIFEETEQIVFQMCVSNSDVRMSKTAFQNANGPAGYKSLWTHPGKQPAAAACQLRLLWMLGNEVFPESGSYHSYIRFNSEKQYIIFI